MIFSRYFGLFLVLLSPLMAFGQSPAEVAGLSAEVGDGYIDLSWDEGQPAPGTIITGYNVYWGESSVQEIGDEYTEMVEVNFNSYTLRDIEAGKTYYVAVTALCEKEECESESYSPELAVEIPEKQEIKAEAPVILAAQHVSEGTLKITFNKDMKAANGSAFLVESRADGKKVEVNTVNVAGKVVTLSVTEDELVAGQRYTITATEKVESEEGGMVEAGRSDTIRFTARDYAPQVEPKTEEQQEPEPEVEEKKEEKQEPIVSVEKEGVMPPKSLAVDQEKLTTTGEVTLFWDPAGDIADQVLFIQENNGDWEPGVYLGATTSKVDIQVSLNAEYMMRLLSVGANGTESDAAEVSFATPTAETMNPVEDVYRPDTAVLPKSGSESNVFGSVWVFLLGLVGFAAAKRRKLL